MPTYFCMECCRITEHLNVTRVARFVGVTRATMYNWIRKAQVHTIVHPSGRVFGLHVLTAHTWPRPLSGRAGGGTGVAAGGQDVRAAGTNSPAGMSFP